MSDAADRIAEIKRKTEEKKKKLAELKAKTKAGGGGTKAKAVRAKATAARAKAVPVKAKATAKADTATATAKAVVAKPAAAPAPKTSNADDAAMLLTSMGQGAPSRQLGALEMCELTSATVDMPPVEAEAYGRFSQTDVSMEDGLVLASGSPEAEPEPEQETAEEPAGEEVDAEPEQLTEEAKVAQKIQQILGAADEELAKQNFQDAVKALNQATEEAEQRVMKAKLAVIESENEDRFSMHMDDELEKAEQNPEFPSFFSSASKLMEKAMMQAEKFDIFATVTQDTTVQQQKDDVQEYVTFFDEDLCSDRTVTDLHWSPRVNDPLMLATYSSKRDAVMGSQEPDGLAVIWSFMMEDRPEQIFECQSSVMTGIFDQFSPHLVIGGTISGQIVVWDRRVGETNRLPVQKTPLTAQTHTDPVYAITQVGGQNQEQTLLSASTDGRVCHWDLKNLSEPQKYYKLQQIHATESASAKQSHYYSDLSVMGIGLPRGQNSGFYAASDDCMLYNIRFNDVKEFVKDQKRAASSTEDEVPDFTAKPKSSFRGHNGPVTGISVHPGVSSGTEDDLNWKSIQDQFGDLVLSSSTDWTINLWNFQSKTAPKDVIGLKCFEDPKDYVYDVEWSSENPTIFSAVDGQGYLSLYDLTSPDIEMPVAKYKVGDAALNRVKWCPKQGSGDLGDFATPSYVTGTGHMIATGDSSGKVKVLEVDKRVAVPDAKKADAMWKTLRENLAEMDEKRTKQTLDGETAA